MALPELRAPRVATPALSPGTGLLPVTAGYTAARDQWSSAWRAAVGVYVADVRARQASVIASGRGSADFGQAQLRGFGSARNYDYVAARWQSMGGQYLTGGRGSYRLVDQSSGAGITVEGVGEWLEAADRDARTALLQAMDAAVAGYCYRSAFHERFEALLPAMEWRSARKFHGQVIGERVTQVPARTREYVGWPVASGYSRSHLDLVWEIRGPDLVAAFISRAPYTLVAPATRAAWSHFRKGMRAVMARVILAFEAQ